MAKKPPSEAAPPSAAPEEPRPAALQADRFTGAEPQHPRRCSAPGCEAMTIRRAISPLGEQTPLCDQHCNAAGLAAARGLATGSEIV